MATKDQDLFFTRKFPEGTFQPYVDKEYDITGFNEKKVVGQLGHLVNKLKETTYYVRIMSGENKTIFRIKTNPKDDQPGNGIVSMVNSSPKTWPKISSSLEAQYHADTAKFAKNILELFSNNKAIADAHEGTAEAYMLLLFEIARRLVVGNPFKSPLKETYDKLPIGPAILQILKLFQIDQNISFKDVFTKTGKYHIFTGQPEVRQARVVEIDKRYREMKSEMSEMTEIFGRFSLNEESASGK